MRVLVVEDEPQLAAHVVRALQAQGHEATRSADGEDALQQLAAAYFDVVVLDVNLPRCDGFEVLARMRRAGMATRVIMLTARAEISDRVQGLKSGADDYLTKPFALEELLARVHALGRRGTAAEPMDVLRAADISFDLRTRKVMRGGEPVALSPREGEVLQVLMAEPGRTFSRDEICERIWQREHEYDTRTVEIFIMRLRKKLDDGRAEPLIETVRGAGYRLRRA